MATKYLDYNGLIYLWSKIKTLLGGKVDTLAYDSTNKKITKTIAGTTTDVVTAGTIVTDGGAVKSVKVGETTYTGSENLVTLPAYPTTLPASDVYDWAKAATKPSYSLSEINEDGDYKLVTATSMSVWSGKQDAIADLETIRTGAASGSTAYQKPNTGIPLSDMSSGVSASLALADTALQTHQDISGKVDKTTTINSHSLDSDITITKGDVGLGSVTNDAQVKRTEMGVANGVATLDANGLIPSTQLPSYVDDVVETYPISGSTELSSGWLTDVSGSTTPLTPTSGKIYVLMEATTTYSANSQFRWSSTSYIKLNDGGVSAITNDEIDAAYNAA